MRKPKDIDDEILKYLEKLPLTATTDMVSKELKISWATADVYLRKLEKEGKIKLYRIGRQNQWILSEEPIVKLTQAKIFIFS